MRVSTILSLLSLLLTLSFSLYTEVPFSAEDGAIGEGFALYKRGGVVYLLPFDDLKGKAIGTGLFWASDRAYVVDDGKLSIYSPEGRAIGVYELPLTPSHIVVAWPYIYAWDDSTAYVMVANNSTVEVVNSWPSPEGHFALFSSQVAFVEPLSTTFALSPDFNDSYKVGYSTIFYNPPYVVDRDGFLHTLKGWKELSLLSGPFSAAGGKWAAGAGFLYNVEEGSRWPSSAVAYFDYEGWKGFDVFASPSTLIFLRDEPLVEKVFRDRAILDIAVWDGKLYVLTSKGLLIYSSVEGCYLPINRTMPSGTYLVEAHHYPDGKVAINTGEGWVRSNRVKVELTAPLTVECRLVEPRKEKEPWEVVRLFPLSWSGQGLIKVVQRPEEVKAGQRVRLYFYDGKTNVPLDDVSVIVGGDKRVVDEYVDMIINEPGNYEVVISKEGYMPTTYTLKVEGMSPLILIVGVLGGLVLIGAGIYYYIVYLRS